MEAHWSNSGLLLTQQKYIQDLLVKANMHSASPVSTPSCPQTKLMIADGSSFVDATQFRSIVGGLQYLSFTRPDISYSVNKVSQYMHQPTEKHWQAVKRILRYLRSTLTHGLLLHRSNTTQVSAYSDSDWASSLDDRKSTSGFCIFYSGNLISWASRKQRTVARSSTEAEYRALSSAVTELQWVLSLLKELQRPTRDIPILWCDNLSATYLTTTPIFHSRSKHLEIDFHYVRDQVSINMLQVKYLSSDDQLADVLTKPLMKSRFHHLKTKLNIIPYDDQFAGG